MDEREMAALTAAIDTLLSGGYPEEHIWTEERLSWDTMRYVRVG